jgi:biotin transport system substrate-specific component
MATLAVALSPRRTRSSRVAYQLALAAFGSWLIAGLAQASVHLPFTPVPITGQTLGVLLVGAALGPLYGPVSILLYLAQVAVGLPFLATNAAGGHDVGVAVLRSTAATGGYLWGFLAAAWVVGWLARAGWDRSLGSSIGMFFIGEAVLYAVGVPWLTAALSIPLTKGLAYGLTPFIIGDALKLLVAAGLLPAAWRLTRRDDVRRCG